MNSDRSHRFLKRVAAGRVFLLAAFSLVAFLIFRSAWFALDAALELGRYPESVSPVPPLCGMLFWSAWLPLSLRITVAERGIGFEWRWFGISIRSRGHEAERLWIRSRAGSNGAQLETESGPTFRLMGSCDGHTFVVLSAFSAWLFDAEQPLNDAMDAWEALHPAESRPELTEEEFLLATGPHAR